jgi:hypothetical protein
MSTKIQRFFLKKYVRISLIVITIFAVSFIVLHTWLVHNTDRLLIELVKTNSGGKLKLQLSKASFNLFSNEVNIQNAKITSIGKDLSNITYQVSFQKVTLTTNSLWSAFFKNTLKIHKIKLYDAVIEVFNHKKASTIDSVNNLSLNAELGKLYNTIQAAITNLNTHSISLINAKLILHSNPVANKKPLVFSNIYFTLKRLHKESEDPENYFNNNNILFTSSNQDINFTDGVHKISFKSLVLQNAENIILDSCTIIASPTGESKHSFKIHFKKLALIGVDFEALYQSNHIKADSVYCQFPIVDLNFNTSNVDSKVNRGIPDAAKILKVFAGNIDVGFLGVTNAEIQLKVRGKTRQTNIQTGKINFEIKNLKINPDSAKLISMTSFEMLIRGYQLYNKDSTSVFSFDSVRFANNKLLLNNFSIKTISGPNKIRNYQDYTMPYFELLGVDWPELIFNQNLNADEAILLDPVINYKKNKTLEISKKSLILSSRNNFNDFMDIGKLSIVNGNVNIQWGENKWLKLHGFNLYMEGNNLADYKKAKFKNDIQSLFFESGNLKLGDINAGLKNITFKKNNQVHADQLTINNDQGGLDTRLNDVAINNINTGENKGNIIIDGLQWADGNIAFKDKLGPQSATRKTSLLFNNISGKNTHLSFINKKLQFTANITNLQIESLQKPVDKPIKINNFNLNGKGITFSNATTKITGDNFTLSDNAQRLENIHIEKNSYTGTLVMDIPSVQLSNGSIKQMASNGFDFKNIILISPKINYKSRDNTLLKKADSTASKALKIDHLTMREPQIEFEFGEKEQKKTFSMPYSKGSEIKADDIAVLPAEIKLTALDIKTRKAQLSGIEKIYSADEGIDLKLSKIIISKAADITKWTAMLNKLDVKNSNGFSFDIKQNKLFLKDISVNNISLSSNSITNPDQFLGASRDGTISTSDAKYSTKNSIWQLSNVSYNTGALELAFASINYHPLMSRDSFISSHKYQVDYFNFNSANAKLSGFDLNKYFNGNSVIIKRASFLRPLLTVYRDKLPPFQEGIKKPLFTEKIKNISVPVSINEIDVDDGRVSYTERNEKNRLEGILYLTHINGSIANISNRASQQQDSLSLKVKGLLQNNAPFELKLDESYSDPLYGFKMDLKIEPTSVLFLNPLLEPLSNVKFIAGHIDKFDMYATGNDNTAQGEMKFYYNNLHINLVKNGGLEKTGFLRKRESDFLNFFFIRDNNRLRTGLIYFKRLKDRSFFNYMNKIIFSGVATSVGAKSNSSYRKDISDNKSEK